MTNKGKCSRWWRIDSVGVTIIAILLTLGTTISHDGIAEALTTKVPLPHNTSASNLRSVSPNLTSNFNVFSYQTLPLANYTTQHVDCAKDPCIALTFDDGPDSQTTPQVLAALERAHAHATFFVIGNKVANNVALLQRMQADGDEVGDHSWSHTDFTTLTVPQMQAQVAQCQAAVIAAGLPAPRYFRPPYEARNDLVRKTVNMPFVLWNIDTKDWAQKTAAPIISMVTTHATPGSIVIMHDSKNLTVEALPQILNSLKDKFHFVTISEIVSTPAQPQVEYFKQQ